MNKGKKIVGYLFGIVITLFGLLLVTELILDNLTPGGQHAVYIAIYPIVGPVLLGVGILICYGAHRLKTKIIDQKTVSHRSS